MSVLSVATELFFPISSINQLFSFVAVAFFAFPVKIVDLYKLLFIGLDSPLIFVFISILLPFKSVYSVSPFP